MGSRHETLDRIGGWSLFTLMADALAHPLGPRDEQRRSASRIDATQNEGGWLDRIDNWFWRQRQHDRERYLAQAQDVFELEARMRDLERGTARGIF